MPFLLKTVMFETKHIIWAQNPKNADDDCAAVPLAWARRHAQRNRTGVDRPLEDLFVACRAAEGIGCVPARRAHDCGTPIGWIVVPPGVCGGRQYSISDFDD